MHGVKVVDVAWLYFLSVELEDEVESTQSFPDPMVSWLFSRAAVAHMDERGREIATRVRTFEPSSGTSVKYCVMEKIAWISVRRKGT